MFITNCPQCETQRLVGTKHILSLHQTSEGIVGYVRCANGHTFLQRFADAYPKPKPPASVQALQLAKAA